MAKVFTLLSAKHEVKDVKQTLKKFNIKRKDMNISKVFTVNGNKLVSCTIITDEETFTKIVEAINGERIY